MVRRNKFSHLVVVISFTLSGLFSACSTTISGKITDFDGQPIDSSEARVNITRLDGDVQTSSVYVIEVSEEGEFHLNEDLQLGDYFIEALAPGYKAFSTKINLKESEEIILTLKRSGNAKASTIGTHVDVEAGRGEGEATLTPPDL